MTQSFFTEPIYLREGASEQSNLHLTLSLWGSQAPSCILYQYLTGKQLLIQYLAGKTVNSTYSGLPYYSTTACEIRLAAQSFCCSLFPPGQSSVAGGLAPLQRKCRVQIVSPDATFVLWERLGVNRRKFSSVTRAQNTLIIRTNERDKKKQC